MEGSPTLWLMLLTYFSHGNVCDAFYIFEMGLVDFCFGGSQIDLTVEIGKLLAALQHERSEIAFYIFANGSRYWHHSITNANSTPCYLIHLVMFSALFCQFHEGSNASSKQTITILQL